LPRHRQRIGGANPQTTALEIVGGKIFGIYMVRNPDKLRHLESNSVH
jgi:RNA polymerase sigma-70 factor (ECF subfamily)